MRLRQALSAAWILLGAALAPARAGLLDTLAGTSRLDRALAPDPTDGLLPGVVLERGSAPGFVYAVHNEFPLHLRRAGRAVGKVSSLAQSWRATGLAGTGAWRAEAVLYQASGGWDRDREPNQIEWSASTVDAGWEQPIGRYWRVAAGYRYGRERGQLVAGDTSLRPTSDGIFHGTLFDHRLSAGVTRRYGNWEVGLGGAWLIHDARLDTQLRNLPAQLLLDQQGWQAAGRLSHDVGERWKLSLAGGYREARNRDTVLLNGVQHGRAWPESEEWRLAVEATGELSPRLKWWGTAFHRDLRLGLNGNATALPPPIGSLAGPRYQLAGDQHWSQSGVATGVEWRAGSRTTLRSVARYSTGRWRASYGLWERSSPEGAAITSSSQADNNVKVVLVGLSVEQRLGTLRAGIGVSGGLLLTHDNLEDPSEPPSPGDGVAVSPGLPFQVWLGLPW